MPVNAIVTANAAPVSGVDIDAPFLTALGTPQVVVPTDAITIDPGEVLTIDGSLVINGAFTTSGTVDLGGGSFIDAVIDGGHADSVYVDAFDIDGGAAA
jgi:hypothetical protein